MNRHERLLEKTAQHVGAAAAAGVARARITDQSQDGATIELDGRHLLNFGSCAYLGLNTDPRLKQGAIRAVERYGPVYSSSTAYTSVDLYSALEDRLSRLFGAHVVLPTTTTLGHLSALPVLITPEDVAVVDAQTHASVHMATQILRANGVDVEIVPHNDVAALTEAVDAAAARYRRVWYLADGVYSMYGDVAPVHDVAGLMERYENLHVYYDDAHGFGWHGRHGRGYVLGTVPLHPRMVVAVSLAKSFGTGGAAIVFPDPDQARWVTMCGGTMTFSGPIHPAELGAAVASADIHLSDEHGERQRALFHQIDLMHDLLIERELPVMGVDRTPIWFVRVGGPDQVIDLTTRMVSEGFAVNPSAFPAVPMGYGGVRFTNTLQLRDEHVIGLVDALARHVPEVIAGTRIEIDLRESVRTERGVAAS